jgi:hypothetical protein
MMAGSAMRKSTVRRMVLSGLRGGTHSSNLRKKWLTSNSRMSAAGKRHCTQRLGLAKACQRKSWNECGVNWASPRRALATSPRCRLSPRQS